MLFPIFPLVGSVIGGFSWLFLWNFKEIKHQPFPMTQPKKINKMPHQRATDNTHKKLSIHCTV